MVVIFEYILTNERSIIPRETRVQMDLREDKMAGDRTSRANDVCECRSVEPEVQAEHVCSGRVQGEVFFNLTVQSNQSQHARSVRDVEKRTRLMQPSRLNGYKTHEDTDNEKE